MFLSTGRVLCFQSIGVVYGENSIKKLGFPSELRMAVAKEVALVWTYRKCMSTCRTHRPTDAQLNRTEQHPDKFRNILAISMRYRKVIYHHSYIRGYPVTG